MKLKIAGALALVAMAAPSAAQYPPVAGTPECDAAAEAYADSRHPWKYSSQWWNHYTWYQNEGCIGVD